MKRAFTFLLSVFVFALWASYCIYADADGASELQKGVDYYLYEAENGGILSSSEGAYTVSKTESSIDAVVAAGKTMTTNDRIHVLFSGETPVIKDFPWVVIAYNTNINVRGTYAYNNGAIETEKEPRLKMLCAAGTDGSVSGGGDKRIYLIEFYPDYKNAAESVMTTVAKVPTTTSRANDRYTDIRVFPHGAPNNSGFILNSNSGECFSIHAVALFKTQEEAEEYSKTMAENYIPSSAAKVSVKERILPNRMESSFVFDFQNGIANMVKYSSPAHQAGYDETEKALKIRNRYTSPTAIGFASTLAADSDGETANAQERANSAYTLGQSKYFVITYKNVGKNKFGAIIGANNKTFLYPMQTGMTEYEDVIVNATGWTTGDVSTDAGKSQLPIYPFMKNTLIGDKVTEIYAGSEECLYIKKIASFTSFEDAESYAKADAASGIVSAYNDGQVSLNMDFGSISELLYEDIMLNTGKLSPKESEVGAIKEGTARTDIPFINGYEDFTFRPDNNMTRAEACAVVTRLLVDETTIKGKNTSKFTDAESGAWYYDYVAYLENNGYLDAYEGTFSPNQPITRAEFVELVYNMGKVSDTGKTLTFKDVDASHPRYKVIMAAASAGLVNGRDDGTFDPDGTIKRSEVVKVLCTALGRTPTLDGIEKVGAAGFADVEKSHWAYPYIIESSVEHDIGLDEKGNEVWTEARDGRTFVSEATEEYIASLDAQFEKRVSEIQASKSEWKLGEGGRVFYISNDGDDNNDGLTPETAIMTINRLIALQDRDKIRKGDVVLFRRGDEWYGKFSAKNGVTYSAYGEGAKPRILGSIKADDPSQWELVDKTDNLYKFNQPIDSTRDVGCIFFNDGEAYGVRVIKWSNRDECVDIGLDNMVSNNINTWHFPPQEFKDELDLVRYSEKYPESDLWYYHDWNTKSLYLYSRNGNPGDVFDSIDISTKGNVIAATSDVTIDNLCIRYGASHGIGAGTCKNLTVRNCEVGYIGGAIQIAQERPGYGPVRFGNAVEIYGGCDGYYVYDNYIHDTFDCGPTVQWGGTLADGQYVIMNDIKICNNALDVHAALEIWLSSGSKKNTDRSFAVMKDCYMTGNLCRKSGYGFGGYIHQNRNFCGFYGAGYSEAVFDNCHMSDNVFWENRMNLLKCVNTSIENGRGFQWRNNVIILEYNGLFGEVGADMKNTKGALTSYRYTNELVKKVLETGTMGFNKFLYTGTYTD